MANKYFRKYLISEDTAEAELYAVPAANAAILSSLRITNGNSALADISVFIYPEAGPTAHVILDTYTLPVNGTMDVFGGVPCILQAGDVLKVSSTEVDVVFYLSYMEVDRS